MDWTSNTASDHDGDGCRDFDEDSDDDGDGVPDELDGCPWGMTGWLSRSETDRDGDGCRDFDEDSDDDGDGVPDELDGCPRGMTGWLSTAETDHDTDGCQDDVEDDDDDGDGVRDEDDACPRGDTGWTSNPVTDRDADGCRDQTEDDDDDGDGVSDGDDACPDSPLGWTSTALTDPNRDGCPGPFEDDDEPVGAGTGSAGPSSGRTPDDSIGDAWLSGGVIGGSVAVTLALLLTAFSTQSMQMRAFGWLPGLILPSITRQREDGRRTRADILYFVAHYPGCHFSEIARELRLGRGQTAYHLKVMVDEGEIWKYKVGRLLCFFPPSIDDAEISVENLFKMIELSPLQRDILVFINESSAGDVSQSLLAEQFGVSRQTISRNLRRLQKKGWLRLVRDGMRKIIELDQGHMELIARFEEP